MSVTRDHILPLILTPAFSRRKRDAFKVQFIAPLHGAEIFSNLIQGWRDLRSAYPWLLSATATRLVEQRSITFELKRGREFNQASPDELS